MNREISFGMVREAHNCFYASLRADCGPRGHAIVANQLGRLQIRIYLMFERLHFDIVKPHCPFSLLVGVFRRRDLVRRERQRILEDLLVLWAEPVRRASENLRSEERRSTQEERLPHGQKLL
jgi:hypothetical protein